MTRSALVLAMASALFLGVSLGFLSGVLFSRHHLLLARTAAWRGPDGFHRGQGRRPSLHELLPRLQERLGLTAEQVDAIRDELERSRADFDRVRDSLHARIERHLTPEQRQRWLELLSERHAEEPHGPGSDAARPIPGRDTPSARRRAPPGGEGESPR